LIDLVPGLKRPIKTRANSLDVGLSLISAGIRRARMPSS
jgi:hypothetical protein